MAIQVSRILARGLSLVYILAGASKVFPFTPESGKAMLEDFERFTSVFPLKIVGYQPDVVMYCRVVGITEIVFGLGLLLGPRKVKLASVGGLMVLMAGAVQTLACLKDWSHAPIPAAFFVALTFILYKLKGEEDAPKGDKSD